MFPISPIKLRPCLLPGWPACSLALVGLTANPAVEEVDGQFYLKDFHLACDILHFKAESKAENEHFRKKLLIVSARMQGVNQDNPGTLLFCSRFQSYFNSDKELPLPITD